MKVIVENEQNIIEFNEQIEKLIYDTVNNSLELESFENPSEISIVLTDDKNIRSINNTYRKIDKATDVLSFPMLDIIKGKVEPDSCDTDPDSDLLLLGDIVVSLETAEKQATEYGHSFERELAFLISHGMFHLLGYDHMNREDEEEMFGKQEKVLRRMGLTRNI
ncbi:MAG: rRNA maturation RNase YbeY [Bacillota bacterium]|nr:rRNA maturation RNase YbeY [Bacillota bacterium]